METLLIPMVFFAGLCLLSLLASVLLSMLDRDKIAEVLIGLSLVFLSLMGISYIISLLIYLLH